MDQINLFTDVRINGSTLEGKHEAFEKTSTFIAQTINPSALFNTACSIPIGFWSCQDGLKRKGPFRYRTMPIERGMQLFDERLSLTTPRMLTPAIIEQVRAALARLPDGLHDDDRPDDTKKSAQARAVNDQTK